MSTNEGLEGSKYNRLTLLRYAGTFNGKVHWEAECDCGVIQLYQLSSILYGNTKSCGCFKREQLSKPRNKARSKRHREYNFASKVTIYDWNEEL